MMLLETILSVAEEIYTRLQWSKQAHCGSVPRNTRLSVLYSINHVIYSEISSACGGIIDKNIKIIDKAHSSQLYDAYVPIDIDL